MKYLFAIIALALTVNLASAVTLDTEFKAPTDSQIVSTASKALELAKTDKIAVFEQFMADVKDLVLDRLPPDVIAALSDSTSTGEI